MSKRTVYDWQRAVYASSISPNVRLLLIFMSEHVREHDKHVSIPRDRMAKALGWSTQRVSERITEAVEHHFLDPVSPGYRGHTAVYQATFPDRLQTESVRKNRSLSKHQKTGRFERPMRPEDTDTTSRAEPHAVPQDRDGGHEKTEAAGSVSRLPLCEWHEHMPCDPDCANHPANRKRTA